ncbi:MAG: carbohydrate kinase family protein [Rubrimonas sp.]
MTFLVCGEALYDLFATQSPAGLTFDARIGGSPFNVAVGLARLGQPSGLLTGLSTDALGRRLKAALAAEGVSTDWIADKPNPTTLSLVDVGPDGGPAYTFYGTAAADRSMTDADVAPLGAEVWGMHAGSYALVADPTGATQLALFRTERGRRMLTLDPNIRLNVEPDLAVWHGRLAEFLACADLVKVSDEDLAHLHPGETHEAVARRWLAMGPAVVIVTRGGEGALGFTERCAVEVAAPRIAVADTVGAGDTFMAALIAGLAETGLARRGAETHGALREMDAAQLRRLLGFAASAAAITCGRRGPDRPRRSELPPLTD